MFKRLFAIAAGLGLVLLPATGSASVRPTYGGSVTSTYSLTVNSDCTLSQSPGGNFAFAPVSGVLGPPTNSSDATGINTVSTQCSASSATLLVYDAAKTGTSDYYLTMGAQIAKYTIGLQNCYLCMFTNSNATGQTLLTNGSIQSFKLVGYLEVFGAPEPPEVTAIP